MEENGHVGVFTPTMTLEGKGKDERLVWVLSRHKNEEVWLGRSRGERERARNTATRLQARTRIVVNPVVSTWQPASAAAPPATDSVWGFLRSQTNATFTKYKCKSCGAEFGGGPASVRHHIAGTLVSP